MRYFVSQPRVNRAVEILYQLPFRCGSTEEEMLRRKREQFRRLNDGYYNIQPRFEGEL